MEEVEFKFPNVFGQEVALVGDFNNWAYQKKFTNHNFKQEIINIKLENGAYQYKFLIDGQLWLNDPQADLYVNNGNDALNSVVEVGENTSQNITNENHGEIADVILDDAFDEKILTGDKVINEKKEFNLQNKQVYIYNTLKNCVGEVELSYVWCTPDFKIYDWESILVQGQNEDQRLYNYINLTDEIAKPGNWKVFILINGQVLTRKEFTLKANFYYKRGNQIFVR